MPLIEQWIATGMATIVIQGVRPQLDSTCLPVAITSFADPECIHESGYSEDETIPVTVDGVITATVLSVTAVVVLCIWLVLRRRIFALKLAELLSNN